jgi:hypothetical protein
MERDRQKEREKEKEKTGKTERQKTDNLEMEG